jgi:AcrR family transcriptional regulator
MGRPREHGPETRERLLETAARILADEGIAALSVRRLAGDTGVSTRAIYSLFTGMPALVAALLRRGAESMVRLHEEVPKSPDPVVEIPALAQAYRQGALAQPDVYALMFERRSSPVARAPEEIAFAMRSFDRVHDAVVRAIVQRGLRNRDSGLMTRQLWAVVHGLASLELRGALGSPAEADAAWQSTMLAVTTGLFGGGEMTHRSGS